MVLKSKGNKGRVKKREHKSSNKSASFSKRTRNILRCFRMSPKDNTNLIATMNPKLQTNSGIQNLTQILRDAILRLTVIPAKTILGIMINKYTQ